MDGGGGRTTFFFPVFRDKEVRALRSFELDVSVFSVCVLCSDGNGTDGEFPYFSFSEQVCKGDGSLGEGGTTGRGLLDEDIKQRE